MQKLSRSFFPSPRGLAAGLGALLATPALIHAQVVSSLESLSDRIPVGDPAVAAVDDNEGPKALTTADLNGDGVADLAVANLDGTVTLLLGSEGGGFEPARHLATGAEELRAVEASDFNADGMTDLAIASPTDGKLRLFFNVGGGNFGAPVPLPAWKGVRSLASGDFDGDGIRDLAAAGPGLGLRHYRGTGGGEFEIMGDAPNLSPKIYDLPRPVYSMHTIRSLDGERDDLLLTHAESAVLYVLSTQPADRSSEPALDVAQMAAWSGLQASVLITEVQVHNQGTLLDQDGEAQPWVELLNKDSKPINLSGWRLSAGGVEWTLPARTLDPGRFIVVFLSGKNRAGTELHANFRLDDDDPTITLFAAGNQVPAHALDLESHSITDISFGLPMNAAVAEYFDVPSPGASNNAGVSKKSSAVRVNGSVTELTITPRNPAPGESVKVTVRTSTRTASNDQLRHVWISTVKGIEEKHYPLKWVAPGLYSYTLAPGEFDAEMPHRVLARFKPANRELDDFTTEIHPGLDDLNQAAIAPSRPGRLLPVASVPSPGVKAFDIGAVTRQNGGAGVPDLVYADEVCGLLRVHRGVSSAQRFEMLPTQDMQVRGGPRDVKLADMDGDGWLDATVVLRQLDLALTCRNDDGVLIAVGELPTGNSPRAVALADFSGDGLPDAAVINRVSEDVSILTTSEGLAGLVSNDQIYPVDGEVAGLKVLDYNGDGRDDVIQLHRGSGEVSVRYSAPDGSLGDAEFIRVIGDLPSGIASADINGDGVLDTVTANLGRGEGSGSISSLLSQPNGTRIPGPTITGDGAMFAIEVADFDNDGHLDLVTGLFDCRVSFFRGDGTGGFTLTRSQEFAYESRVMVVADFDQDGNLDIAGAGRTGELVVLKNTGTILDTPGQRDEYAPPSGARFGAERIALYDADGDADPDLVIGSGSGVMIYRGTAGVGFEYDSVISDSIPNFAVNDVVTLDLDSDGTQEMVVLCRQAACVNILTQSAPGEPFTLVSQASIPAGRYLASGDLDGDGKPDLVCTGDVLWTVLSSRPPEIAAPRSTESQRETTSGVLINEVLSRNTGTPVASDAGRKTDFIEIYNSTDSPVALDGWRVDVVGTQDGQPFDRSFTLPAGRMLEAKSHRVVLFSDEIEKNPAYTGFNLPAERSTVTLKRPDDSVADSTQTPNSLDNVSWARFRDGHPVFHANPIPSPEMSNLDNGTPDPDVKLAPPTAETLVAGQPIRFTAKGKDDVGIVSLSLLWKPLGTPGETQRVILYDDGMHDDGATTDGYFVGQLAPGLPAGSELQFYMEATDLSGNTIIVPDDATLVEPGNRPNAWTISLEEAPTLAIVEVAPYGNAAHKDEAGKKADYIVVRNTGSEPVDMDGVLLAKSPLSSDASTYAFPSVLVLSPGAEAVVFADNDTEDGPMHAPFTLDAGGGDLSLLAESASGARRWIDSLTVPDAGLTNVRYRMLPGTERWVFTSSSSLNAAVGAGNSMISYDRAGSPLPATSTLTRAGDSYRLEGQLVAPEGVWETISTFIGDGSELSFVHSDGVYDYLRIVHLPPAPTILSVDTVREPAHVWLHVDAPNATTVGLYYSVSNDLSVDPAGQASWRSTAEVSGGLFVVDRPRLNPNPSIYYRLRASNSSGEVWSEPYVVEFDESPGASFNTLGLESLSDTSATISAQLDGTAESLDNVRVLYGLQDRFADAGAWADSQPCTSQPGSSTWRATVSGLIAGQAYIARFAGERSDGTTIVSGPRILFRAGGGATELARWGLKFTEIMYHPFYPTPAELEQGYVEADFDYFELHNATDTPIDLSGWYFTDGVDLNFPLSGGATVAPGQYGVIASHPHAFAMRYGSDIPILAWTLHPFLQSKLSNRGESLTLTSPDGTISIGTYYNDNATHTDGGGHSLELGSDGWWTTSRASGGSPGFVLPEADITFAAWQASVFTAAQLADPAISDAGADPDGDGLTNGEEFRYGSDPLQAGGRDQLQLVGEIDWYGYRYLEFSLQLTPRAASGEIVIEMMRPGGSFEALLSREFQELRVRPNPDGEHIIKTIIVRRPALDRAHYRARFLDE